MGPRAAPATSDRVGGEWGGGGGMADACCAGGGCGGDAGAGAGGGAQRAAVADFYGAAATGGAGEGAGIVRPGEGCGGQGAPELSELLGYSAEELRSLPEGSNLGLGCGNPVSAANLKVGPRPGRGESICAA